MGELKMDEILAIDVRGLEHAEKEKMILPNLEELEVGKTLSIVLEFNPLPLVYMLNAMGEFDIVRAKEGPPDWILEVRRTSPGKDRKEQFKKLLRELKEDTVTDETKEEAKDLFQAVDARTIGIIEQEMIREGVSHDEIRESLCDVHLEIMRDSLVSMRIEVSVPHPINTLMEEHVVILESLNELGSFIEKLGGGNDFEGAGLDLEKLKDIAHHLVEAESHHQREEDTLFPILERHDIVEPPAIMKLDHVEFRKRKKELYKLAHNPEGYDYEEFKDKVCDLGEYLVKELERHIFKEDNILYQIALQVVDQEEWKEVKRECDKIGYCCFTPEDQASDREVVELDLRPMPPFERHEKIFEVWDSLKPGQTLKITIDHDPKPLHYQFDAEQKGKFEWEYKQAGPKDWVVKIKRI